MPFSMLPHSRACPSGCGFWFLGTRFGGCLAAALTAASLVPLPNKKTKMLRCGLSHRLSVQTGKATLEISGYIPLFGNVKNVRILPLVHAIDSTNVGLIMCTFAKSHNNYCLKPTRSMHPPILWIVALTAIPG